MEINEYVAFYQLPIGTKVHIKDCHARPQLAGKAGFVAGWLDKKKFGYPLMVYIDEPIYIAIPGIGLAAPFEGPHFCRPDELLVDGAPLTDIPDAFKNWTDETGGTDEKPKA